MHLSGISIYPVKSLRGVSLTAAHVDGLGIVGDRRFMLVDQNGRFLTQRVLPRMALIRTALSADALTLSAEGAAEIQVQRHSPPLPSRRTVSVWKSQDLQADDCGDDVAEWLGRVLGLPCRLVRAGAAFERPILKSGAQKGDLVNFADAYPFLALGEASLADLNARLLARGEPAVPIDRFRPNLVVRGSEPYAEDTWTRVRMGNVNFRSGGPCVRCIVTTTDQLTGQRGKEPLRTLSTFRRDPTDPTGVIFGQNLIHESKSGTLRVGDVVETI